MVDPEVSDPVQDLADLWRWFGEHSARDYSPLYAEIAASVAGDRELLALVREAPATAHLPVLLLAGVHYLLLGGLDHPLADLYGTDHGTDHGTGTSVPADPADPAAAPALFRDLCLSHREQVLEILHERRVQTNEVGRSALIGPALTWAAARLPAGTPLRLVDVGASAGLNLLCDRYLLDYADHGATGDPRSEVRIGCRVAGGDPPIAPRLPPIERRVGIDLDPPDLTDPDDARWLLACMWPGTGRLERTRTAIDVARRDPPHVVAGDAFDLLPEILAEPADGADVVVTTWSFSYVLVEDRPRFVEILERAGRRRPLAWLACDATGVVDLVALPDAPGKDAVTAVFFDAAGTRSELLGFAQSHGAWLDWRAGGPIDGGRAGG